MQIGSRLLSLINVRFGRGTDLVETWGLSWGHSQVNAKSPLFAADCGGDLALTWEGHAFSSGHVSVAARAALKSTPGKHIYKE